MIDDGGAGLDMGELGGVKFEMAWDNDCGCEE